METIDKLGRLLWWTLHNWRRITWAGVKNFLEAKFRQYKSESWILEQADWRQKQVAIKSPSCILTGACIHCGCETPDKFMETLPCEEGCYPEWMEREEWEKFKSK